MTAVAMLLIFVAVATGISSDLLWLRIVAWATLGLGLVVSVAMEIRREK